MKKIIFALCAIAMATALVSCGKNKQEDTKYDPTKDGIVGEWLSEGSNVSALLAGYFNIVKITADFKKDNTYTVKSWDNTNAVTVYEGTYVAVKSGVGNIWNITLNQSAPSSVTSEGIFEILTISEGYIMKYEVVQTEPSLGSAPTAAEGFGSSAGGALGTTNIQQFVRIEAAN